MHNFSILDLYPYFLCFCRILGLVTLAPLFSQREIFSQVRVLVVLTLCLFMTPLIQQYLPPITSESKQVMLFYYMLIEFFLGAFIGLSAKIVFYLLDLLGNIIGSKSGLSNAMLFNPASNSQTPLPTMILTTGAVVILFAGNFHHTLINVLYHSYAHIDIYQIGVMEDLKISLFQSFQKMFALGLQFSFPFIIVMLILNFSIGLLNKIIPQIQVFSIIMPAQVLVGFMLLAFLISHIMEGFMIVYEESFLNIFQRS